MVPVDRENGLCSHCGCTKREVKMAISIKEVALVIFGLAVITLSSGAPQAPADEKPMPYEFQYEVKNASQQLFYNHNEKGVEDGSVSGQYQVLHPDGRLMTVTYTVSGDSGFVSKISYDENSKPF